MIPATHLGEVPRPDACDRIAGRTLSAASVLTLVGMAFHPSTAASTRAEALVEICAEGRLNAAVHGGMIALSAVLVFAFARVARRLGTGRAAAGAGLGMVAYTCGAIGYMGAALLGGFVVPALAESYAEAGSAEIDAMWPAFRLAAVTQIALARTGVVAISAAVLCFSLTMVLRSGAPGAVHVLGALGILAAVFPAAGVLTGHVHLHVHGMGAVVLVHSGWSVAVGHQLMRGRL